jgi:ribosomal protein S18 acetylase RimI-like enzyme
MEMRAANEFSTEQLTEFWNLGYSGYFVPVQFTAETMAWWLRCGDFDLSRSLVARDGTELMGFSFLGVRGRRGWIGGFGVEPAYRGRGVAQQLFKAHLDLARQTCDSVQLEVLVENWARKVYERAGMAVTRRLGIFQGVPAAGGPVPLVQMAPVFPLLTHHHRLHQNCPAVWQREISWIEKSMPPKAEGIYTGSFTAPTGYLIVAPAGDTGIRLIDGAAESDAAARELVAMAAARYPGKRLSVVNEPDDGPLCGALTAAGLTEDKAQWELSWSRS